MPATIWTTIESHQQIGAWATVGGNEKFSTAFSYLWKKGGGGGRAFLYSLFLFMVPFVRVGGNKRSQQTENIRRIYIYIYVCVCVYMNSLVRREYLGSTLNIDT